MRSIHIGWPANALGLCLLLCGLAAPSAGWAGAAPKVRLMPPPWTRARKATGPLTVDGALDESAWAKGPWNSWFSVVTTDPAKRGYAKVQTRFRTLYSDEALYVGVECADPTIGALKLATTADTLTQGDCIELFIDPAASGQGYHHLVVNTKGIVASAYRTRAGPSPDARWRCTAEAKGAIDATKGHWSVELRIPFATMRFPAKLSDEWRINVARRRYAGGALELTSWSTLPKASFHVPRRFGTLVGFHLDFRRFRRPDPAP